MNIVVFEDSHAERLFPVTIGRPCYAITCASYRLIDWVPQLSNNVCGIVRPYLSDLQSLDYQQFSKQLDAANHWTLVLNARVVPSVANIAKLKQVIDSYSTGQASTPMYCKNGDDELALAIVPTSSINVPLDQDLVSSVIAFLVDPASQASSSEQELKLFSFPHDIVRENLECFGSNIGFRTQLKNYVQKQDGVFASPTAVVSEYCVMDTSKGPIVIDNAATIGPFCYLQGPVYIGARCRIIEHASIKDCVSLGHTTKLGGEVEATVIESYSNKQHHGFIGHSYLGSWINLGAGTCNSDLKNTYGQVNMEYGGGRVSTDMQFIGCIIGDYSKTAINTGVFTGKTIGACSMVYGFVTTNVPSFVNYARSFGQTTELPPAVMRSTQKRMFGRRNVEQRPCDIQLLNDMYQSTSMERQLSEEPLSL